MSAFEKEVLLPLLQEFNALTGAVHSWLLAEESGIPERTARYHLRRMELAGAVARPYGPRRGWAAVDVQLRTV